MTMRFGVWSMRRRKQIFFTKGFVFFVVESTKKEGIASLLVVPSFFMRMKEAGLVSTRILSDRGATPRWGAFSADRAGRLERLPSGPLFTSGKCSGVFFCGIFAILVVQ